MRYWITLVATFLFASSAVAEEQLNTNMISLKQVIVKVLENNPQLLAGDVQSRLAVSRINQARQPASPLSVNLELENFAGSDTYSGSDSLETTLSFARVLELGDKPALRENVARFEANLLQDEQDAKRLDILADAARRFTELVLDQHKLVIAESRIDLIRKTQTIVAKRVRLGKSPESENRRVRIELERAKIELEHIQHELKVSRLRLSSLWGNLSPAFSTAQADLFLLQEPGSFNDLEKLLARNPDLAQYATRERLAHARLSLARSRSRTDVGITGGIRHFNETSDTALVLSASMALGASSRARPYEEEAQLLSQLTPYNQQHSQITLHNSLFALYQEIHHAFDAVKALQDIIIPEAKQVLDEYRRGYAAGRYSLVELHSVQNTLLDAQLEAAVTASNFHRNKIEIERLTGKHMVRSEVFHETSN